MANRGSSLLVGRRAQKLSDDDIRQVTNTFNGIDKEVPFVYRPNEPTQCSIRREDDGNSICEILFGEDIYPGSNIVDPNSILSMRAAVAHECVHYHRWKDRMEVDIDDNSLIHIEEAFTSLSAILRYGDILNNTENKQLISDAIQRLDLFVKGRA